MKSTFTKTLTLFFLIFLCNFRSYSMSVSVSTLINAWCGGPTGALSVDISGGTAPYTYSWDNGGIGTPLTGLFPGTYTVTVTDQNGVTGVASGDIGDIPTPPFYAVSAVLPNIGQANGSIVIGLYTSYNGPYALNIPPYQVDYILYDSTGINVVNSYHDDCTTGTCMAAFYTFSNLPKGHYIVECQVLNFCSTTTSLDLKEIPAITPSMSQIVSCNGSPTGRISINTHPSPSINAATFSSNLTSSLGFVNEIVSSKYKAIVYDAVSNPVAYYRTQDSILRFDGLIPGNYTVQIYTGDTIDTFNPGDHDSVLVYSGNITVGNDVTCSYVKGNVFADYNNNCVFNFPDRPLYETLIQLSPGGSSATSDRNGNFYIPIPNGTYTLKQYAPYYYTQICPDTSTFTIVNSAPGSIISVTLADSVNVSPDLQLGLIGDQPRPGFGSYYTIRIRNLTANYILPQTITFNYDSTLTVLGSDITPVSSSTGQLTFASPQFNAFDYFEIKMLLKVPVTAPLGSFISANATISNAASEINTADNSDSISQVVVGSYDPNLKEVSPVGYGSDGYITADQLLKYTIEFQNTGTDTAFNVVVSDTLSAGLDIHSLRVLNASHPYSYEFASGNVVKFNFNDVLLTDSGSNEAASHGYIKFSIQQLPGNIAGISIDNTANIYFDFNAPVQTNSIHNLIFDCNQLATTSFNNTTICEGTSIEGTADLLFDMETKWYLDGFLISTDSIVNFNFLSAGNHSIRLNAANNTCSQDLYTTVTVNALPPQPTVTVVSAILTSSSATGNQWYFGNIQIGGANGINYTATANGYYSVSVTDVNGCSIQSDSVYVNVTGINQIDKPAISISPNPVDHILEIRNFNFRENDLLAIYDLNGKKIYSKIIHQNSTELRLSDLDFAAGIYYLQITNNDVISQAKFVKE